MRDEPRAAGRGDRRVVAGIYGMNFTHMPALTHGYGYPVTMGVMGAVAAAMVAFFWRDGWFR